MLRAHRPSSVAERDGENSRRALARRSPLLQNRNRNYEIYIMDPDGNNVRRVANTEGRRTVLKRGKDGKTCYFTICKKVDFKFDCEIYAAKLDAYSR